MEDRKIADVTDYAPRGGGSPSRNGASKQSKRGPAVNGAEHPAAADGGRPSIRIEGGKLPYIVDQAERALLQFLMNPVYQRGGLLVRPAAIEIETSCGKGMGHRLVPVTRANLVELFTEVAQFERFLGRDKKWVATNCPREVADTYLARVGEWRVPTLLGVIRAPTLRPDGSIIDRPGFDRATGLLFEPAGAEFPKIPQQPNKEDARAALSSLNSLIAPLSFVDGPDRAVALAAILTAGVRRSLPHAPLFAYTAPVAGAGKSKAVDVVSNIWCGHPAPVTSQGGSRGDELEKRLNASLIGGDSIVSIDNCEHPLASVTLCQAISQPVLRIRQFNTLSNLDVPSNGCFFATGNNLVLAGDLPRRSLLASLDPKCERPETRVFDRPAPDVMALKDRARYAIAALTILWAYVAAGRPPQGRAPLGGYETWSYLVRDALLWLGEDDPCITMERVRANDPVRITVLPVMECWASSVGTTEHDTRTAREIVELAKSQDSLGDYLHPDFRNALLSAAGEKGGNLDAGKLGYWLRQHKDRIFVGRRFICAGERKKVALWRLQVVNARAGG